MHDLSAWRKTAIDPEAAAAVLAACDFSMAAFSLPLTLRIV
jgi:hypothetical protein